MSAWRGTWALIAFLVTYCTVSATVGWFVGAFLFALVCDGLVCLAAIPMIVRLAKLETAHSNGDTP